MAGVLSGSAWFARAHPEDDSRAWAGSISKGRGTAPASNRSSRAEGRLGGDAEDGQTAIMPLVNASS